MKNEGDKNLDLKKELDKKNQEIWEIKLKLN